MKFGSILKGIVHGFGVAASVMKPLEPFIAMIPGIGVPAITVFKVMDAMEDLFTKTGDGAQRRMRAIQIIDDIHPGLNQADLGSVIDGVVAGIKLIEDAFKKLPATAPAVK